MIFNIYVIIQDINPDFPNQFYDAVYFFFIHLIERKMHYIFTSVLIFWWLMFYKWYRWIKTIIYAQNKENWPQNCFIHTRK